MQSKETLVEILVQLSMQEGGNATEASRRSYFRGHTLAVLQAEHDRLIEKKLNERAARETTAELEREKVIMQVEQYNKKYPAQSKVSEEDNRKIFAQACRKAGISECDANFRILVLEMHGDLFDTFTAVQTIAKNPAAYVPSTAAEQVQRSQETQQATLDAAVARQRYLQTCSPAELRRIVAEERQQRAAGQVVAENGKIVVNAPARSDHEIAIHREIAIAYEHEREKPDLPLVWRGKTISSAYISEAGVDYSPQGRNTLRDLLRVFGNARISARHRGITTVSANLAGRQVTYVVDVFKKQEEEAKK